MAVQTDSYNLYLRAIADPSGFTQFSAAAIKELRSLGAITEVETRKINALTANVASGAITAAKGMQQLNAVINGINPAQLRALSNLGFDRAGLDQTTKQLTAISTLLSEIQSKSNAIVRTAAGLAPSTRVAAALGGTAPVAIERTGTSGNAGIYQITSSLGTSIARGQKEAQTLGNQVLIAELSKLRVAMLAQASTNPAVVSGLTATDVLPSGDLRANTSAIQANTAATTRDTAAINRLTDAVNRVGAARPTAIGGGGTAIGGGATGIGPPPPPAITGGVPRRPVQPQGPYSPPSGALYFPSVAATGLASVLNRLYAQAQPQVLTGSPGRVIPQGGFAAPVGGPAQYLGRYTPDIAGLQAALAARKEIAALDALEASRKSGVTRADAIRETRAANEAILQQRLAANPIVDDLSPYIGSTAYNTLLNSGRIRGQTAAKIPEEGLAALGLSADQNWWRQQGAASFPVPGLGNYRDYAPTGTLGFADADRRAQLQRTVDAADDNALRQTLFSQYGIQARNVQIAKDIARAYERIGAADAQKLAALNAANRAAIQRVVEAPRPVGEVAGRFPAGPSFYPPAAALPAPPAVTATPAPPAFLSSPAFREISAAVQEVRAARAAVAGAAAPSPRPQVDPRAELLARNPNLPPAAVDEILERRARANQLAPQVSAASASRDQEIAAAQRLAAAENALAAVLRRRAAMVGGAAGAYPALNASTAVDFTRLLGPLPLGATGGVRYNPRALTPGTFVAGPGGVLPPGPGVPPPPQYPGPYGYQPPPPRAITAGQVVPPGYGPTGPAATPTGGAYRIGSGPVFEQTFPPRPGSGGVYSGGGGYIPPGGGGIPGGGNFFGGGPSARGSGGGFFDEFARGFRGLAEKSYAFQIGQVAKFSLLYGTAYSVLFNVSRGLQAVVQQAIEYQASLSSLALVTGESKEGVADLADSLGRAATALGIAPGVGVEAGAKAIGIFGLQDETKQVRDYGAQQVADIALQQQFLSGADSESTIANLGAISSAFGLTPESAQRVSDLDAFFTKQLGTGIGTTLETLAQTGTLAESAGFTLEEAQVLAGVVKQRTGQTPAAVAGLLSQFYGRAGDPQLRDQIASLGIDVTGTSFADQIKELALLPQDDPQVRNALENSFGRGRGKGAVGNVIQAFAPDGAATDLLARAEGGEATGAADAALEIKLKNIAGQLAIFQGALLDLSVNLGRAGLLEVFGAAVVVLQKFVELLNNVLKPFSELPGILRAAAAAVILFTVATRTGAAASIASRLATASGFIGPTTNALRGPGSAFGAVGARGLAAGALSYAPMLLAVGSVVGLIDLFGNVNDNADAYTDAVEQGKAALAANNKVFAADVLASATAYNGIVSSAQSEIDAIRSASSERASIFGFDLPGSSRAELYGTESDDSQIQSIEADRDFAEFAAALAARRENQAATQAGAAVFTDPSNSENVASTLDLLAESGVSATESMRLLSKAMFGIEEAGKGAALAIDKQVVATTLAGQLGDRAGFFGEERIPVEEPGATGQGTYAFGVNSKTGDFSLSRLFLGNLSGEGEDSTQTATNEFLRGEFGALPFVDYNDDVATKENPLYDLFGKNQLEIQEIIAANLPSKVGKSGEFPTKVYENIIDEIVALIPDAAGREGEIRSILEYLVSSLNLANTAPEGGYTAAEVLQQVKSLNLSKDQQLAALVPGDTTGQQDVLQKIVNKQRQALKGAAPGEDVSGIIDLIDQTNYELIDLKLQESERLRLAAQEGKSDAAVKRIGQRFQEKDLRLVVKSGSIDRIVSIMDQSNRAAVRAVLAQLKAARDLQVLALRKAKELAALIAGLNVPLVTESGGLDPAGAGSAADAATAKAQRRADKARERYQDAVTASEQATYQNTYEDPEGLLDAEEDTGPTAAQIAAAKAAAEAARRGGQISIATAALQSARADLEAAEAGTVEYYNALSAVYEAQRSLAEAIRADRINKYLLANDITDPVVQAQAELRAARQKLAYDQRQGASPELIREDRLAVRQAEANAESTRNQQWLSDLQTAESLERISHAQYIRHLERRRDRLNDIKKRTYQQQQDLDEVNLALKAAKESLSSQFNIGDIKVPTPYEVRRYIEQAKANAVDNATGNGPRPVIDRDGKDKDDPRRNTPGTIGNQITNYATKNDIKIDGADTAQIIRILRDILGNNAIKSTATKTGKR